MGPVKSRPIIMGIPVRSHEMVVPGGWKGKGMSNGGPGIISNTPESAPSMLASASFLVASLSNCSSPVEKRGCTLNNIYVFCKIRCLFCQFMLACSEHFFDGLDTFFNQFSVFQVYHS